MATMKGLVSLADMTNFAWNKYDIDQKMRHSDLQGYIPNKLRRMISVNPDQKMIKQLEDFKAVAHKYGFVLIFAIASDICSGVSQKHCR